MGVYFMGVMCVEAFRFSIRGLWGKVPLPHCNFVTAARKLKLRLGSSGIVTLSSTKNKQG
jgi:hypothetical protein